MPESTSSSLLAEVATVARWLALCLVLTAAAAPLAMRLLRGLPDRGLGLAPLLGVILATAILWWTGQDWTSGQGARARLFLAAFAIAAAGACWATRSSQPGAIHGLRLTFAAALLVIAVVPIPFTMPGVWVAVIAIAALSFMAWWGDRSGLRREWRRVHVPGIASVVLFAIGFGAFVLLRAQLPGAYPEPGLYGAEKGGNMMHLASAMRTTWFPVADAWFLGEPVNYYNGGHIAVAMLAKGSAVSPAMAFNLGLATLFGLTLSTAFSLGYNLLHRCGTTPWRTLPWALVASGSVGLFGNLDAFHQVLHRAAGVVTFDFWRSSRVYSSNYGPDQDSGTITEFPAFSALLGDLHAHHMALPVGMFIAALLVSLWRKNHRLISTPGVWWNRGLPEIALLALAMAVAFVVNTWDAVVYAPIVLMVLLATFFTLRRATGVSRQVVWPALSLLLFCGLSILLSAFLPLTAYAPVLTIFALVLAIFLAWLTLRSQGALFADRLVGGVLAYAAVGAVALLLAFPQLTVFKSPLEASDDLLVTSFPPRLSPDVFVFSGIVVDSLLERTPLRIVPVPLRTSLWEYLTMWGLFVIPISALMALLLVRSSARWSADRALAFLLGALALFFLAWNAMGALAAPFSMLLALLSLCLAFRRSARAHSILWLLIGMAFFWHSFVELLYFDDAYTGHRVRYNTPFKIMYPTWPLLAIGAVFALRRGFTIFGAPSLRMRGVQLLVLVIFVRLGMIYPMEGTAARLRETHPASGTIDAMEWMATDHADDLAVIRWMTSNIAGTPRLLEAPPRTDSASYTRVGRVAGMTGIPTLVGWPHHQAQWRGWWAPAPHHLQYLFQYDSAEERTHYALFNDLADQAEIVYFSAQIDDEVTRILDRLEIELIFVGSIERERYAENPAALEKFEQLEVLHRSGETTLYRVARGGQP